VSWPIQTNRVPSQLDRATPELQEKLRKRLLLLHPVTDDAASDILSTRQPSPSGAQEEGSPRGSALCACVSSAASEQTEEEEDRNEQAQGSSAGSTISQKMDMVEVGVQCCFDMSDSTCATLATKPDAETETRPAIRAISSRSGSVAATPAVCRPSSDPTAGILLLPRSLLWLCISCACIGAATAACVLRDHTLAESQEHDVVAADTEPGNSLGRVPEKDHSTTYELQRRVRAMEGDGYQVVLKPPSDGNLSEAAWDDTDAPCKVLGRQAEEICLHLVHEVGLPPSRAILTSLRLLPVVSAASAAQEAAETKESAEWQTRCLQALEVCAWNRVSCHADKAAETETGGQQC